MTTVAKFGGSVLSDGTYWQKILKIISQDENRRIAVVSAIGRRFFGDAKVTDLLISFFNAAEDKKNTIWQDVALRYKNIACFFNIDAESLINETYDSMRGKDFSFCVSRGEYLSAKLFSLISGMQYLEAARLIKFDVNKNLLTDLTEQLIFDAVKQGTFVMGGFYGSDTDGNIVLFDRGGSDITGALLASAVNAEVYENWTDVNGFFVCDPRVVLNPHKIDCLSFEQLKILSTLGAGVLHAQSVYPVQKKQITVDIKSIFKPHLSGTLIVPNAPAAQKILGITGRQVKKLFVTQHKTNAHADNALYCCQNCGFCTLLLKETEKEKYFCDGILQKREAGLISIAHSGVKEIAEKTCFALSKQEIKHQLLCNDGGLLLIEINANTVNNAIKTIYSHFFE